MQQCLPLVLCPVYSVLMAEEPLRFSRIIVSVAGKETVAVNQIAYLHTHLYG